MVQLLFAELALGPPVEKNNQPRLTVRKAPCVCAAAACCCLLLPLAAAAACCCPWLLLLLPAACMYKRCCLLLSWGLRATQTPRVLKAIPTRPQKSPTNLASETRPQNLKAHNTITGKQGGRLTASMVRVVRVKACASHKPTLEHVDGYTLPMSIAQGGRLTVKG